MPNLIEKTAKSYSRQEWQQGYASQPHEYDYWVEDIEGEIPTELQGTFFRNGPGLLDVGNSPIHHPFDGDGMVSAISFQGGRVHFRNRFVRTEAYLEEQRAGKILYRGVFGTQKPGGWLNNAFDFRLKNIANTSVIYWGNKLLALWEAAEPYRLDPRTLETIGIDRLDEAIAPGGSFGAHPWIDPSCALDNGKPCLVNFSLRPGLSTTLTIYEFNPQGELLRQHSHSIPGFAFLHDFAITPHYCVFFQNPVTFNPLPFVFGLRGAGECIKFHASKPTRIVVIPRTPPYKEVKTFETQAGFVFHHVNAFEEGNKLNVDSICYQSFPEVEPGSNYKDVNFEALDPGQVWRFTIDLGGNTVQSRPIEKRCCEFPAVHPDKIGRPYRYLFIGAAHQATGNAPLQAILKLDYKTQQRQLWSFAPSGFISEPVFVPKSDAQTEDEGWVLAVVYDARHHRSDVVVLDGQDLTQGPIATAHLKHHIPYGLHGSWTPECFIKGKNRVSPT
ncbi:MAG: carotenoid oxygenase family protein [Cyanophyceae cyanobacterium]